MVEITRCYLRSCQLQTEGFGKSCQCDLLRSLPVKDNGEEVAWIVWFQTAAFTDS